MLRGLGGYVDVNKENERGKEKNLMEIHEDGRFEIILPREAKELQKLAKKDDPEGMYSTLISATLLNELWENQKVNDKEKIRQLESALVQSNAILDWIQGVLDEDDVSDFALSFPIVREVLDLKTLYIQLNSNEIE